jgi:ParB family chromosome partitioning protein
MLGDGRLTMGHARTILALPTEELQRSVAEKIVSQGLSVRATEKLVQSMTEPREIKEAQSLPMDPNVKAAEEELRRVLGTRVNINAKNEKRGRIEIEYYSQDELQRLYGMLVGEN